MQELKLGQDKKDVKLDQVVKLPAVDEINMCGKINDVKFAIHSF